MPILKSSKHFTRSWRRWGDRVTKLLHKCFSQTLHYYTSIHQCTVTSVAHTLSPSLSPPLNPHTYTPHATHTLTQSKSGRYELIGFLEVEEIGFQSRLEGVDSCSISNVQWQWVPDRRTKVRESTITICLALIEWNFEEAGVSIN